MLQLPIPNNFPLQELAETAKNRGFKELCIDKIATIATQLYLREPDEEGWTHLSSIILRKLTWKYKDVLQFLHEAGVVKEPENNIGVKGETTKRYSFSEPFESDAGSIIHHTVKSRPIISKIAERDRDLRRKNMQAGICHLTKWIPKLTINAEEAIAASQQAYLEKINNPELVEKYMDWNKLTGVYEEKSKDPANQLRTNLLAIHNISSEEKSTPKLDTYGNRLHSVITSLASNNRQFLRCNGERLIGLDFGCFQPFLTTVFTKREFWQNNSIYTPFWTHISNLSSLHNNSPYISSNLSSTLMLSLFTQLTDNKNIKLFEGEDIERYKNDVQSDFYNLLSSLLNIGTDTYRNREDSKMAMMLIMFSDNLFYDSPNADYKRAFDCEYPNVYKIFTLIKHRDKNEMCMLLQRLESYLVLNVICKRISRESPRTPIYTIHDSLLTTPSNVEMVRRIMKEEAERFTGCTPILREDDYEKANK